MLSSPAINEFKEIYLKKYGVLLSEQEAVEHANKLMGLYKKVLCVGDKKYGDFKDAKDNEYIQDK